jgi:hypothetical protein
MYDIEYFMFHIKSVKNILEISDKACDISDMA